MSNEVKKADIDADEKVRLNKLKEYDLVEECGKERFEKIVEMAARLCQTEYAAIHFIDEHTQRCKVSYGVELGDLNRRDSVCQYTILNPEPLVVPDLREDDRFAQRSYVKGKPHLLSYAGAPLQTPEGQRIGSLCVLDTEPREFTDDQVETLQLLAEEVINRLELYLRNKELEEKNKEIENYAEKRDAMIKEIHHRLKNNLSYIIGILDLEKMNNRDAHVQQLIKKIQKRIMSVAKIHQRLYEADNLQKLDVKSYLQSLANDIEESFSGESKQITCSVDGDSLSLKNEQMTPFGLLMSELLINAFKHAFEGQDEGEIKIHLNQSNGAYQIQVEDNGVGLPEDFTLEDTESMGSQLITSFLEQLDADIDWKCDNGTCFTITFDPET